MRPVSSSSGPGLTHFLSACSQVEPLPNRRDFDLRFLRPARVYYKSDISMSGFNPGSEQKTGSGGG